MVQGLPLPQHRVCEQLPDRVHALHTLVHGQPVQVPPSVTDPPSVGPMHLFVPSSSTPPSVSSPCTLQPLTAPLYTPALLLLLLLLPLISALHTRIHTRLNPTGPTALTRPPFQSEGNPPQPLARSQNIFLLLDPFAKKYAEEKW